MLFNAVASALWSQTTVEIRRALAEVVGLSRRSCERVARVEFAKVAEYQARGVVHFHAVVRLDGPDGPSSPLPSWASFDVLEEAVRRGVARVSLTGSEQLVGVVEPVVWGSQVDVRRVLSGELADGLSDVAVARYVAKYATKAAEASGVDLPKLYCASCFGSGRPRGAAAGRVLTVCPACHGAGTKLDFSQFTLSNHARRLVDTCWRLGGQDEYADLKLRKWAHMLGFRGHFATKSRTYSTTFTALRQERADYAANTRDQPLDLSVPDDVVLAVNHWTYAGRDTIAPRPTPLDMSLDDQEPSLAELEGASGD